MIDVAHSEDHAVEFIWRTETEEWKEGAQMASRHPQMMNKEFSDVYYLRAIRFQHF